MPLTICLIGWNNPNKIIEGSKIKVVQEDVTTAEEFVEKSRLLDAEGDFQGALKFLEKAKDIYFQLKEWEKAINCVVEQAKLADVFETVDVKLEYSQSAVELAQQHLSPSHPILATAYRQGAEALIWIEQVDSASQLLLEILPIFEEHSLWVDLGWSQIFLGLNYLNANNLEECQKYFEKAESLLNQQVLEKEDHVSMETTLLSLLGILYQIQGDYDRAIEITKRALSFNLATIPIDSTTHSTYLSNLGVLYSYKGDYQRALDYSLQALHSHKDAGGEDELFFNIGVIFSFQKKYHRSTEYFHKTLKIVENQPNPFKTQIDVFNSLGGNFKYIEIYDSAFYYCQKAIEINLNYGKADSWNVFGEIAYEQKKGNQAIAHFLAAIKAYQKDSVAESSSPFYLANIYTNLAGVYALKGSLNNALHAYQKALTINHATFKDSLQWQNNPPLEGVHNPEYFLETVHGKAKTLARFTDSKAHLKASLETYQLLIQWTDSLQVGHATETASLDWAELFKQIYGEAIDVAYRHYQSTQDLTYLDLAFAFSEKSKNSLLLESLKAAEGKSYAGVPDSLLQKEKDLKLDVTFYERVLQEAKINQEEAKIKLYEQYFSKTRLELAELKEQLEEDFPKFYALKYGGKIISIEEVQSKILDNETAFLEYFIGDRTAFVFVITQNTTDLVPLNSPSQIEEQVAGFRQNLLNTKAFYTDSKAAVEDYQQKATQAYRAVLEPVLAVLPSGIQKLVLVPDEFLNSLPFEALTTAIVPDAGFDFGKLSYVLQDYQVHYAYSADLLLNNQDRQAELPANDECLAFAPSYEEGEFLVQRGDLEQLRSTTENLEGTALEIQAIARFFDGQFDFGEKATENQFKKHASQYGILHLAMHGVPDFTNANFNHLKFTNIATQNDSSLEDNLLHHYEIASLDLQAQLAVLSACETGIGKYEKGEGVYSLARSFMYAGVPSVVMSLWKVSDKSTSQLMPFFYENLANGLSKGDALGQAKNRFLKEASLEFRHPFYWSAFVLLGNSDEIKQGYGAWVWWGVGGLVFVLGLFFRRSLV
ncbi:MAG: CHAT domain-containing protein [Chitinophagales bacterium]